MNHPPGHVGLPESLVVLAIIIVLFGMNRLRSN